MARKQNKKMVYPQWDTPFFYFALYSVRNT